MAKCNNCKNLETKDNGFDAYSWCEKINDCPHENIERNCEHYAPMTRADKIRSMTENEAIIRFDFIRCALLGGTKPHIMPNEENIGLVDAAIQALEEVQQYRQIGTVEECRAAMEKQTAIPREIIEGKYFCPKCHNLAPYPMYCGCGQKLY